MENKFYEKQWFMWLTLILFTPVGIFLLWKYNRYNQVIRIVLSVIFALFFINFITTKQDITANTNKTVISKTSNIVTQNTIPKLEDFIKNISALKGTQNMDDTKPSLKRLSITKGDVLIEYNPDESFSIDKTFVCVTLNDVLKDLSKRNDFKTVSINLWMTLNNSYGQKVDVCISKFKISQKELAKINFDGFDYNNLPMIADTWWVESRVVENK